MPPIHPDIEWYSSVSERKGLPGRCPYASIHRCPRYFESVALLSDAGITTRLSKDVHDATLAKWLAHELAPATSETAASISGGKDPHCYSNFCPEVAYDTFKLFGTTLIHKTDDPVDRQIAEANIKEDPAPQGKYWRWTWSHVEPLHYSDCPMYAKLHQERAMANITFTGPVSGNINVAGHSISAPVLSLSFGDVLARIESSSATPAQKEAAKSKLAEFLSHPVIAAVVGGLAGSVGS